MNYSTYLCTSLAGTITLGDDCHRQKEVRDGQRHKYRISAASSFNEHELKHAASLIAVLKTILSQVHSSIIWTLK